MRSVLVLSLLTLAACGRGGEPAPRPSPAEHGYIAKVQALTPAQREGVLLRAIVKGGGPGCQGVGKVDPQPPRQGQPIWIVPCTEGSQWLVQLADDGTATVTGARDPNG